MERPAAALLVLLLSTPALAAGEERGRRGVGVSCEAVAITPPREGLPSALRAPAQEDR